MSNPLSMASSSVVSRRKNAEIQCDLLATIRLNETFRHLYELEVVLLDAEQKELMFSILTLKLEIKKKNLAFSKNS